jgi:hypothetical protein
MLTKITKDILSQIPDNIKLTKYDLDILKASKDFVMERLDLITTNFYDTLYKFEKTKVVFHDGERPIREKSFKHWVDETLTRDLDEDYWKWQTFVGLIHIKRGIKNDIFITMLNYVTEMLTEEVIMNIPKEQAVQIIKAWLKLTATVSSLITEGYRLFYHKAVENVTGFSQTLLDNTVKVEIDNLVSENQKYRL